MIETLPRYGSIKTMRLELSSLTVSQRVAQRSVFTKNFTSERELVFTFAICCLSSVCLSVTLVHPTQAVVIFGNISTAFGTVAIH